MIPIAPPRSKPPVKAHGRSSSRWLPGPARTGARAAMDTQPRTEPAQTTPGPTDAVAARGLTKIYAASGRRPAVEALKSVDLSIPVGSFFGLLGPNGAGKSTFINLLSGLARKTAGTVEI